MRSRSKLFLLLFLFLILTGLLRGFIFLASAELETYEIEDTHGWTVEWGTLGPGRRHLVKTSNGTLWTIYKDEQGTSLQQIYVEKSIDNGTTWIGRTRISTQSGSDSYADQDDPALAVDSRDNLHALWYGGASDTTWYFQMRYSNRSATTGLWTTPIRLSTLSGMNDHFQYGGSIAVDSMDTILVAWEGYRTGYYGDNSQIFFTRFTTSWETPVRISTHSTADQYGACVTADGNDDYHVVWSHGVSQIYWTNYSLPGPSWKTPIKISNQAGSSSNRLPCIAVSGNNLIAGWGGRGTGDGTDFIYVTTKASGSSWTTPIKVSTATDPDYPDEAPSIGVTTGGRTVLLYFDGSTVSPHSPPNRIFMAMSSDDGITWDTPFLLEGTSSDFYAYPSLLWSRYPSWNNISLSDGILYVRTNIVSFPSDLSEHWFGRYTALLPENIGVSISNMEGCGSWLFADEREYLFEAQYRFSGNATHYGPDYLDTMEIRFSDGFHTIRAIFDKVGNSFEIIEGTDQAKLGTGSWEVIDSYTINVTWPIYLLGPILDSYDVDIFMMCNTTMGDSSGWEQKATDYFNIYSEGGRAEYSFSGSSGRTQGGDAWEIWAGGSYSPPDIFVDLFGGDQLLAHWINIYAPNNTEIALDTSVYANDGENFQSCKMLDDGPASPVPYLEGAYIEQAGNHSIQIFHRFSSVSQGTSETDIRSGGSPMVIIYLGNSTHPNRITCNDGLSWYDTGTTFTTGVFYNLTIWINRTATTDQYDLYWAGSRIADDMDLLSPSLNPRNLLFKSNDRTTWIDYVEIWREDPGGTSGTATVTALWRKLQAIRFQWAWGIEPEGDGSIEASHSNEGYVEFGVDYCDPFTDAWISNAWKCRIFIESSALGGSDDWIRLNVSWYDRAGSLISSDILYSYWEGKDGDRDYFRMWTDLWFNKLAVTNESIPSSVVAGRVNAYYFGMHDSSNPWINWITGTAWAPMLEDKDLSMFFYDLKDGDGTIFSSRILELMKVRLTVYRSADYSYAYRLREFEVVDPTQAKGYMVGIDTPAPQKTQTLNLNQGGLLSGVIGWLMGLATSFYINALLPFGSWFIVNLLPLITEAFNTASQYLSEAIMPLIDNFIYALWPALGENAFTGWITTINQIFGYLANFITWMIASMGYAVDLFTSTFLWLTAVMGKLIYFFVRMVDMWIQFWTILSGMFTGGYGVVINVWDDWAGATWLFACCIFYPVYLFIKCDEENSFAPISRHAKAWRDWIAWMIMLFVNLFNVTIRTFSFVIESLPVIE